VLALIPLLPFAGFLVNALFGKRLPKSISGGVACAAMIAAFGVSLAAVTAMIATPEKAIEQTAYTWIASGGLQVGASFYVDPLAAVMVLVITGIGSLIHIY
jgi:NADH-quinone oxidoreductase subunit L